MERLLRNWKPHLPSPLPSLTSPSTLHPPPSTLRLLPSTFYPPPRSPPPLHRQTPQCHHLEPHADRERPPHAHPVHQRHDETRPTRCKQAPREIQTRARSRTPLRKYVHKVRRHDRLHRHRRPARDEGEHDGRRDVDAGGMRNRPAEEQDGRALDGGEEGYEAQTSFLEGEGVLTCIGALGFEDALQASEVLVEQFAGGEGAEDGADAVGDEGEADLRLAEAVARGEQRGRGGDAHLPHGVVDGQEEDDGAGVLGGEDAQGAQDVEARRRCRGVWTAVLALELDFGEPLVDGEGVSGHQAVWRSPSVSDRRPQRLRKQNRQHQQEYRRVPSQHPENRPPPQRPRYCAPYDGSNSHRRQQSRLEHPHIPSPLRPRGDIPYYPCPNRNTRRRTSALHAPQHHQGGIALRQTQPHTSPQENDKRAEIRDPSAVDIGHGAPKARRQGLENKVACYGQVDCGDGDTQVRGDGGQGGEVDVGCEARDCEEEL
ncbi:hypothetical protein B5807_08317 [Epicoccum nigrum]|uniref:Uncharacterized protein n=1 Tax=Epicoccum nigrum TaxID=105696 RepID=A0A1Y2LQ51_EPING|nr:hypothetical protein B5807_08317 [Epicoccum nigrum]